MRNINTRAKLTITDRARSLRRNTTQAERVVWKHLRDRRFLGSKFRRQHPIGPYVVDFFNVACNLAIEIDGHSHFGDESQEYDRRRTAYLQCHAITVIRFTNEEVYTNLSAVLDLIHDEIDVQLHRWWGGEI